MIRYSKLGYLALNVTDIEKSKQFYTKIVGLQFVEQVENGPVFLRCSNEHHDVVLYETDGEPGLKRIGFEMESAEQLEIAYDHFTKEKLNPKDVHEQERKELKQGRTFRFTEPNTGVTLEFYNDIIHVPQEYDESITKIKQLGHVVLWVKDFDKTLKFFEEIMNFRVSDYVGEQFAFMRCFPNPFHHSFAIGQSKNNNNKFHHVAFMVRDLDDIGIAQNRMFTNGVPIVHGPGRHTPSGSIFLYFLDPDELTIEYSRGMEEFEEEGPRKPRMLEPSLETINIWGQKNDPRKAAKGHIEVLNQE